MNATWRPAFNPCAIVDVGAASYGGEDGYDYSDSLLFLSLVGRECTVHAFDLSATKLRELQSLAANISSLRTHHVALSDHGGRATVRGSNRQQKNLWSIAHDPQLSQKYEELPTTTLAAFARAEGLRGIRYVKVDVQGHDPQVAHGMEPLLRAKRLGVASFEYSQHWQSGDTLASFQAWAGGLGYSTYLVAADAERQRARLVPAFGRFWHRDLELCTTGGPRCVIDLMIVPTESEVEAQLLRHVNGWRCKNEEAELSLTLRNRANRRPRRSTAEKLRQ